MDRVWSTPPVATCGGCPALGEHDLARDLGAPLQGLPFFIGHRRLQDLHDTGLPKHARHGERDAIRGVVRSDRNHPSLVAQHDLRNASRHHADSELARLIAFDDGDVGVPDFLLDAATEILAAAIDLLQSLQDPNACDLRRRPYEHFRRSVLTQDVGFHRCRIDMQVPSHVKPEAQAVEKRPRAQDSRESECADEVGQRVRWIGHDQDDRVPVRS